MQLKSTGEKKQMSDLTDKDFKVVIMNMFKELKKTIIIEVKEGMMTMLHQIENNNKEIEIILKKRTK